MFVFYKQSVVNKTSDLNAEKLVYSVSSAIRKTCPQHTHTHTDLSEQINFLSKLDTVIDILKVV